MSDIEWKENAVCAAAGLQFGYPDYRGMYPVINGAGEAGEAYFERPDLKINEIREGDFIQASELDNKKKFDDAVDMFGLFGFEFEFSADDTFNAIRPEQCIFSAMNGFLLYGSTKNREGKRLTYHQIIAIGKLKRMMLEREKSAPKTAPDLAKASSSKYEREITDRQGNIATVDVYDVLKAFEVTCPATQHAVKKLLCSGLRGHKDLQTDLIEAKESITRAIELN